MSITLVRKSQIRPLNIIRSDINTTTSGSALITKVIAGTGLALSSSTGVNPGTGDVTIALSIATASVLGGVKIGSGLTVAVDGTISVTTVSTTWGAITGTLSNQTDLQAALNAKYNNPTGTSSQYIDGTGAYQTFPSSLATGFVRHRVKAGVAINKGQAVYVTSSDGTNMIVGLASNASEATSSKTMGLLDATVSINGFANVVTEGLLAGLNTVGANAGDPVWLGTGGNLIYGLANKPYAPAHLVFIGIVTRVNANNGEIFVKVQNGFELDELHDVDLKSTTPVNGHILGYNGTLWVNKTIAGWLGYTPQNAATAITTSNIGLQSVNYANSAGSATLAGYVNNQSGQLYSYDNRVIAPADTIEGYLQFGFTSWNNNGGDPYADYLHMRSYSDASGGTDNLIMFKKSGIGMRIWQQTWGSNTPYAEYVDVWTTNNFTQTNVNNWNTAYSWGNHSSQNYATQTYVNSAIAALVDAAPGTLDTLNELAAALGDDPNFATTVTNNIATKMALYNGATGSDLNALTKNGIWRTHGGANGPNLGTHTTLFSAFQEDSNYGWQLASFGSESLFFRFKDANFAGWTQLATRSWIQSQAYLTSYTETDTLQSVTSRGSSTNTDISIGGTGGDRGLAIYHGDYGRIRFYQGSTNISTIHSFATDWQSGNVFVSGGALNITGNTGVTIGAWNVPDVVFRIGGISYFRNSVGIGVENPGSKLHVEGANDLLTLKMTSGGYNAITLSTTFGGGNNYAINPYISGISNGGFEIKDLTNNVSRIVIAASTGNVGVNTATPAYKLQVAGGDIAIDFNRYLRGGSGGDWNLINLYNGATGDIEITMLNANWYLRHNANATFAGLVGIGTPNPGAKLHVVGNTYIQSGVLFVDTIAGYATNKVSLAANTNFFLPSGNIGIKALNTTASLSLGTSSYDNNPLAGLEYSQVTGGGRLDLKVQTWGSTSDYALTTGLTIVTPGFDTNNVRVGIGTINPEFKLDVNGTGRFIGNVSIGTNYNGFALNVNGTTYIIGGNLFVNVGYKIVNTSDTSSIAFSDDVLNVKGALIPISDSLYNLGTTTLRWRTIYAADLNLTGAATINGSTVWHAGNLTNLNQLANGPGYITGYTETNTFLGDGGSANTHPGTDRIIFTGQLSAGAALLGMPATDNSNSILNINRHPGEYNSQLGFSSNGSMYYRSFSAVAINSTQSWRQVWDSGNLTNLNQLVNGPGYITGYAETDTLASVTARGATTSTPSVFRGGLYGQKAQTVNNYTTAALWTESYDNTTTGIAFHISGVVGKFLEMRTNGILYWEDRQVWTAGNLTSLSQLSNDPGYLTSSHTHDLGRYSLAAPQNVDGLTSSNFRSTLFGLTSNTWNISTARWNSVPSGLSGMNMYGTMFAWSGSDTHGFIATDYSTANIQVGGGSGNSITWRATLIHSSNIGSYALTSYTETDTLNSVTTRGASTGNAIEVGGLTVTTRDVDVVTYQGRFQVYNASATGNLGYRIQTDEQGGWRWQFVDGGNNEYFGVDYPSGNLIAKGTITEQSSLRYKENIINLESITDKVDRLRPVRYNKIGNTNTEIGLIAEEVAEVFPEFVNYNAKGEVESLNYTRLSVVLLQTVKELSDKINKLETK
jgi:hypothetical protein